MASIAYHAWWPGSQDPFYLANVEENTARIQYYGADYTPHVYFDGIVDGESGGPWEQMILDRATVESPLRIELVGDPDVGTITATVTNTSGFPVTGTLHFVIVENGIVVGGNPQEHAMRDFFPDVNGEVITFQPSVPVVRAETFVLDPGWVEENLECVVFVQNDTSTEVYQAAKIFFLLDEPELLASELNLDDTAGNGDGFFDPGETIDLSVALANLNPVEAVNVAGTLQSGDPYAILVDDSGTWLDIPGGGEGENVADPFTLSADSNTPWGYQIPLTLGVTSDPGYATDIEFKLGVGQPLNPIGPDEFGFYCYEGLDSYVPSPTFDWVEIDPNLGGQGAIVTLGDDQTVNRAMPFEWRLYGNASDRVSICSNGFIALGNTTNREFGGNIPGPEGPPNPIVAAFWTDLNPLAPGGGKVYEWYDAANSRYIVEFSGVEHYAGDGNGPPETFQWIIYDPAAYPTQNGDSQVDIQYLVVSDPSSCTVGSENETETIGIEYQAGGAVNVAAHGLADRRVMRFTTTGPDGIVGVDPAVTPVALSLVARPNPFRAGATIHYAVPSSGAGELRIFTPDGVLVRTLLDGTLEAGRGDVRWDGRNDAGVNMPAGMYLYRLSGDGYNATGKLVRLR